MNAKVIAPDVSQLELPVDAWTRPFWEAAARGELLIPCCADCTHFRWPPGPFCPVCQSQQTSWQSAGPAFLYTFTIIPVQSGREGEAAEVQVPALVTFPRAQGIRIPAAIVDSPLAAIQIGVGLELDWSQAANVAVPVFRVNNSQTLQDV